MQLKHVQSITQPSEEISKVTALCWAPNGKRLAACTTDRIVLLFDEEGNRKDKFATKPADKGPKNYIVRQMVFSPQSDKLAIAQSDNIVFVYKIGSEWGDKKTICNKFQHSSSITSLAWPSKRLNEIVYGLADGKVKIGQMKTYKPATLYETDSYVTAICCNPSGSSIISAHLDGRINCFSFDSIERGAHLIAKISNCVPFALAWGGSIVVAGNDGQVRFFDEDGGEEHCFDHTSDPNCREFTAAVMNPTGDSVVLGNYDALYIYTRNKDSMAWEQRGVTRVENMYSVTAMDWKSDGDKLAVGTLCGIVDLYDICVKRTMFKGGFEVTYVSHSQVIVRQVETNMRIVVRSQYGCEILKTNIHKNRYVIATTTDTLLLGDLETLKLSEIQWKGNGTEKFIFDNPNACIIYFAGELSLIEYGFNDLLGSVRTANINSHVLSLRINERPPKPSTVEGAANSRSNRKGAEQKPDENKKIAFLLDAQSICVKDLVSQSSVVITHDSKVDWLELNSRANLLLFRDKRRHLHLYNIETQIRSQLLNFCTYVQWVPNSDVVVAQNRSNLCVWYNIMSPDRVTIHAIKGDVEEIERSDGHTEVIVDEGISQAVYPLDEGLIEFGTACDDANYEKAMDILENLEMNPEVEAMWKHLRDCAMSIDELSIARRCSAAMGDVSLSRYLGEVIALKKKAEEEMGLRGTDHYLVRSKLSLLQKDLKGAELELVNQGKIDECIEMYQKLMKNDAAIRVAEQARHPEVIEMRQAYFQFLIDTNQEEQAAALKERECDFQQAINLYLAGGMPGKAAQVIIENNIQQPVSLLDNVAAALTRAGMHDRAGDFYERLNELQRALDSYIRGHAYRKATDLARRNFPSRVVELQAQWGDYLVSQKQIDMAINHYIEAKEYQKAIEAALNARQYSRALQLVDVIDARASRPYYKQLARHYEDSNEFDLAERCYISADEPNLAVEMHTKLGHWEIAYKLAMRYMSEGEVGLLYINQAQALEQQGRLKEAERLYLTVKEKDLAINMYKKHRRFEEMVRLVIEHRPDLLKETHQYLAQTLEMEGSFKDAEQHYVDAQEWHSAVNMYRSNELWDDAIRVAKLYGGIPACKRVTIALLMGMGVPEGAKYLVKHGLVDAAIEHATENGAFDMAFELATQHLPKKLPEIYFKHALCLEDDEHYAEAEEEFLKANKPKEAIDMYVHQSDWENALRVAETHDASTVPEVYIAQARVKAEANDFREAEELYLSASRPELALAMYQEADMWSDALRLAQMHLPHRVVEVNLGYQQSQARRGKGNSKSDFISAGRSLEQTKQYSQAIDSYLSAKQDRIDSISDLEEIWEHAIEIARNFVPNRLVEVAVEVSRRLVALKRDAVAADVLFDVGRKEEAVEICIKAKKFDKARALSQGIALLRERVEEAHQAHLISNEDTGELIGMGKTDDAMDVLARKGDWEKLWDLAGKERTSPVVLGKYIAWRVDELVRGTEIQIDDAVRLVNKKNFSLNDVTFPAIKRIVLAIHSRANEDEDASYPNTVLLLRETLYRLAKQQTQSISSGRGGGGGGGGGGESKSSGGSVEKSTMTPQQISEELEELLMATHYQHILLTAKSQGLKEIAAKCAVTLMKYPTIVPQDKAFYQAGIMSREVGNKNLAFMLLNRYVDLTEAIDTKDSSFLDNSEYLDTDAIPLNAPLPTRHYLTDEDAREEVRTWVLSVVTDSSIEQRFPTREQSRNTLYEGMYSLPASANRPNCIVTGYPVQPADVLEINNSIANRRDWNAYVGKTKTCPWTGQPQTPVY